MTLQPMTPRRTFVTPLNGCDLLDVGQIFPREELVRRVLSLFWRSCCGIPGLSLAPAPVVELSSRLAGVSAGGVRVRAWWVLYDGIVEESEGPYADRLALFFGTKSTAGQLWPRYEFEIFEGPLAVDMKFHHDGRVSWSTRVSLEVLPDGAVRVRGRGALHER
jgi:hypothetical protein